MFAPQSYSSGISSSSFSSSSFSSSSYGDSSPNLTYIQPQPIEEKWVETEIKSIGPPMQEVVTYTSAQPTSEVFTVFEHSPRGDYDEDRGRGRVKSLPKTQISRLQSVMKNGTPRGTSSHSLLKPSMFSRIGLPGWGSSTKQRQQKQQKPKKIIHLDRRPRRTSSSVVTFPQSPEQLHESEKRKALEEDPELINRYRYQDFLLLEADVNGYTTEILIDTGCQHSVISTAWTKKLGIHALMDKREKGTVIGVGSAVIHGKIWRVPLYIPGIRKKFNITVNVMDMDTSESPLILGLDFLTKYKCNLNVRKRLLEFPGFTVKCSKKTHNRVWR